MFIAFDGLDGAGKTTQAARLGEFLVAHGLRGSVLKGAGPTPLREHLLEMQRGNVPFNARSREYIKFLDTLLLSLRLKQRPVGDFVIVDRYYLSFFAYSVLHNIPSDVIEFCLPDILEPDLYFYLDVDPRDSLGRILRYRDIAPPEIGFRDANNVSSAVKSEMFVGFQQQVRDNYLSRLSQQHIVLDAALSEDALHQVIVQHVTQKIPAVKATMKS